MNFLVEVLTKIMQGSGFAALDWRTVVMLLIACLLLYMGIGKFIHTFKECQNLAIIFKESYYWFIESS